MYNDTVTLFCRYIDQFENIFWYPTVLFNVNLTMDKAAVVAKYGAESQDNAILNAKYVTVEGKKMVDGKEWLPPKDWENQTNDMLPESLTFKAGSSFNFFYLGEWEGDGPILDDDYRNGFYDYMNKNYDYVFAITSVGIYNVIPHFEIVGK